MAEDTSTSVSNPPEGHDKENSVESGAGETQVQIPNAPPPQGPTPGPQGQVQQTGFTPTSQGQGQPPAVQSQGLVPSSQPHPVQGHDGRPSHAGQGQLGAGDGYMSIPMMPSTAGWPAEQMQLVLSLHKK